MPKPEITERFIFRYPDNPFSVMPSVLLDLEKQPGRWIAQLKYDGFRSLLYKENGQWIRHSKYDTGPQARKQIPLSLISALDDLNLPDGTAFDAEWMGLRAVEHLRGRHFLVVFDLHYMDRQWQGDLPYVQRLQTLKKLLAKNKSPDIELIGSTEIGLLNLFEQSKSMPLTEGIVVKAKDSLLKGGRNASVKNPKWMKVKWRA